MDRFVRQREHSRRYGVALILKQRQPSEEKEVNDLISVIDNSFCTTEKDQITLKKSRLFRSPNAGTPTYKVNDDEKVVAPLVTVQDRYHEENVDTSCRTPKAGVFCSPVEDEKLGDDYSGIKEAKYDGLNRKSDFACTSITNSCFVRTIHQDSGDYYQHERNDDGYIRIQSCGRMMYNTDKSPHMDSVSVSIKNSTRPKRNNSSPFIRTIHQDCGKHYIAPQNTFNGQINCVSTHEQGSENGSRFDQGFDDQLTETIDYNSFDGRSPHVERSNYQPLTETALEAHVRSYVRTPPKRGQQCRKTLDQYFGQIEAQRYRDMDNKSDCSDISCYSDSFLMTKRADRSSNNSVNGNSLTESSAQNSAARAERLRAWRAKQLKPFKMNGSTVNKLKGKFNNEERQQKITNIGFRSNNNTYTSTNPIKRTLFPSNDQQPETASVKLHSYKTQARLTDPQRCSFDNSKIKIHNKQENGYLLENQQPTSFIESNTGDEFASVSDPPSLEQVYVEPELIENSPRSARKQTSCENVISSQSNPISDQRSNDCKGSNPLSGQESTDSFVGSASAILARVKQLKLKYNFGTPSQSDEEGLKAKHNCDSLSRAQPNEKGFKNSKESNPVNIHNGVSMQGHWPRSVNSSRLVIKGRKSGSLEELRTTPILIKSPNFSSEEDVRSFESSRTSSQISNSKLQQEINSCMNQETRTKDRFVEPDVQSMPAHRSTVDDEISCRAQSTLNNPGIDSHKEVINSGCIEKTVKISSSKAVSGVRIAIRRSTKQLGNTNRNKKLQDLPSRVESEFIGTNENCEPKSKPSVTWSCNDKEDQGKPIEVCTNNIVAGVNHGTDKTRVTHCNIEEHTASDNISINRAIKEDTVDYANEDLNTPGEISNIVNCKYNDIDDRPSSLANSVRAEIYSGNGENLDKKITVVPNNIRIIEGNIDERIYQGDSNKGDHFKNNTEARNSNDLVDNSGINQHTTPMKELLEKDPIFNVSESLTFSYTSYNDELNAGNVAEESAIHNNCTSRIIENDCTENKESRFGHLESSTNQEGTTDMSHSKGVADLKKQFEKLQPERNRQREMEHLAKKDSTSSVTKTDPRGNRIQQQGIKVSKFGALKSMFEVSEQKPSKWKNLTKALHKAAEVSSLSDRTEEKMHSTQNQENEQKNNEKTVGNSFSGAENFGPINSDSLDCKPYSVRDRDFEQLPGQKLPEKLAEREVLLDDGQCSFKHESSAPERALPGEISFDASQKETSLDSSLKSPTSPILKVKKTPPPLKRKPSLKRAGILPQVNGDIKAKYENDQNSLEESKDRVCSHKPDDAMLKETFLLKEGKHNEEQKSWNNASRDQSIVGKDNASVDHVTQENVEKLYLENSIPDVGAVDIENEQPKRNEQHLPIDVTYRTREQCELEEGNFVHEPTKEPAPFNAFLVDSVKEAVLDETSDNIKDNAVRVPSETLIEDVQLGVGTQICIAENNIDVTESFTANASEEANDIDYLQNQGSEKTMLEGDVKEPPTVELTLLKEDAEEPSTEKLDIENCKEARATNSKSSESFEENIKTEKNASSRFETLFMGGIALKQGTVEKVDKEGTINMQSKAEEIANEREHHDRPDETVDSFYCDKSMTDMGEKGDCEISCVADSDDKAMDIEQSLTEKCSSRQQNLEKKNDITESVVVLNSEIIGCSDGIQNQETEKAEIETNSTFEEDTIEENFNEILIEEKQIFYAAEQDCQDNNISTKIQSPDNVIEGNSREMIANAITLSPGSDDLVCFANKKDLELSEYQKEGSGMAEDSRNQSNHFLEDKEVNEDVFGTENLSCEFNQPRCERSYSNSSDSSLEDFDGYAIRRVIYERPPLLILPALLKESDAVDKTRNGDSGPHGQYISYSRKAYDIKDHARDLGMYVNKESRGTQEQPDTNVIEKTIPCDMISIENDKLSTNRIDNKGGDEEPRLTRSKQEFANEGGSSDMHKSQTNCFQDQIDTDLGSDRQNSIQNELDELSSHPIITSRIDLQNTEERPNQCKSEPSSADNTQNEQAVKESLIDTTNDINHENQSKLRKIVSKGKNQSPTIISSIPLSTRPERDSNSPNIAKVSPYLHRKNFTEPVQKFSGGVFGDQFDKPANETCTDVDQSIFNQSLKSTEFVPDHNIETHESSLKTSEKLKATFSVVGKNKKHRSINLGLVLSGDMADVEDEVVKLFLEHIKKIDNDCLGITRDDIRHVRIENQLHDTDKRSNSFDSFVEDVCVLELKGNEEHNMSQLAYESLIPKQTLEKYVSLLLDYHCLIFSGPSGTGKSYLARRIADVLTSRLEEDSNNNTMKPVYSSHVTSEEVQNLIQHRKCTSNSLVLLIDGFASDVSKCVETLSLCLENAENKNVYAIVAVRETQERKPTVTWKNNIRWIWLANHEDPVNSLLIKYLRKKFMLSETNSDINELMALADWLNRVWKHLNNVIERFHSAEHTIGPAMFFPCPTKVTEIEEWFVDIWNYSLVPYILQTIRSGIGLHGQRCSWLDPLDWVLHTYPWQHEMNLKSKLRRLRMEDVGYRENFSQLKKSELEQAKLISFIRRLEKFVEGSNQNEISRQSGKKNRKTYLESAL